MAKSSIPPSFYRKATKIRQPIHRQPILVVGLLLCIAAFEEIPVVMVEAFAPSPNLRPSTFTATTITGLERKLLSTYDRGTQPAARHKKSSIGVGALHVLPPDQAATTTTILLSELAALPGSSFLTAFSIFPGSSVVDPVVVSHAFWDGITRQFVSLVIGNILAVVGFSFLTANASEQMSSMGTFVSDKLFGGSRSDGNGIGSQSRLRQPPPGYNGSLSVAPDFSKLAICVTIDIIGSASGLIPLIGDMTDLFWAPIAALTLRSLYGSNVIFALEFAEEILLFTDILPLATICWVVDTFFADSKIAFILQIGIYRDNQQQQEVAPPTTERPKPKETVNLEDVASRNSAPGAWRQVGPDSGGDRLL